MKPGLLQSRFSNTVSLLFNLRQGSDYEIDFDTTLKNAQDAVNKAAEFVLRTGAYFRKQLS